MSDCSRKDIGPEGLRTDHSLDVYERKCYSDWLCPKRAYVISTLGAAIRRHPLLKALLGTCRSTDAVRYVTRYYPIYRIIQKYMEVLPELCFLEIVYDPESW